MEMRTRLNERKSNHGNEGPERDPERHAKQPPYWMRAHHDWKFWVGFVMMFAAITIFVLSDNLRFLRHP